MYVYKTSILLLNVLLVAVEEKKTYPTVSTGFYFFF